MSMSSTTTDMKNVLFNNATNILNSMSFYSPIIISVSIIVFSMFIGVIDKALVFFVWIFIITFLRIIVFRGLQIGDRDIPQICLTGLTEIFIPKDITYSTYILSFTMMYFLMPMIMISKQKNINAINYGVLAFFIAYIVLDLFIKKSLLCIPSFVSSFVIGDVLSGLFLGALVSGIIMYGSAMKKYLYINEINGNNEVCSMPSKQQYKCRVFKDGELVGNL